MKNNTVWVTVLGAAAALAVVVALHARESAADRAPAATASQTR